MGSDVQDVLKCSSDFLPLEFDLKHGKYVMADIVLVLIRLRKVSVLQAVLEIMHVTVTSWRSRNLHLMMITSLTFQRMMTQT